MKELYWGNLTHLGYNMWYDEDASLPEGLKPGYGLAQRYLRCDRSMWDAMRDRCAEQGVNMIVIDLGEGVQYESHPELAVEDSWSVDELRAELAKLRSLGITPIPKLNFALTHNKWLGPYRRMATSDLYNQVCRDVIHEVCDIFDTPPMFHLGMDEEEAPNQINMQFAAYRQFDLWWHDLYLLFDACEEKGVRPALWSDYANNHPDEYMKRMSHDAVQFQWYYWNFWENVPGDYLNLTDPKFQYTADKYAYFMKFLRVFRLLNENGFDQIPSGSLWNCEENFTNLTEYCRRVIDREHLLGFMQTIWKPTLEAERTTLLRGIDLIGEARRRYRG